MDKLRSKLKRKHFIITLIVIVIGIFVMYVFKLNEGNNKEKLIEVSFTNPTQAIIFWRSEDEVIGFVKYGEKQDSLESIEYQTSSDPALTHAVVIDNVPMEGLYYQVYEEPVNPLIFPQTLKLQYGE